MFTTDNLAHWTTSYYYTHKGQPTHYLTRGYLHSTRGTYIVLGVTYIVLGVTYTVVGVTYIVLGVTYTVRWATYTALCIKQYSSEQCEPHSPKPFLEQKSSVTSGPNCTPHPRLLGARPFYTVSSCYVLTTYIRMNVCTYIQANCTYTVTIITMLITIIQCFNHKRLCQVCL